MGSSALQVAEAPVTGTEAIRPFCHRGGWSRRSLVLPRVRALESHPARTRVLGKSL